MIKHELIDPPVTPYSPTKEIEKWIAQLKRGGKPWSKQRKEAIAEAEGWLKEV